MWINAAFLPKWALALSAAKPPVADELTSLLSFNKGEISQILPRFPKMNAFSCKENFRAAKILKKKFCVAKLFFAADELTSLLSFNKGEISQILPRFPKIKCL